MSKYNNINLYDVMFCLQDDDGTDDVCCGRYKCAEQLLMFINRKEKETNGTSK